MPDYSPAMKILVLGAGRIGSAFAFHLSTAGHDVCLLARGERLATLRRDGAVIAVDGRRAPVAVTETLDPAAAFDLLLVTVMAHQVEALLPAVAASAARTVLFMFNTFETTARWREAVGAGRFAFGFPNMVAFLEDGRLRNVVDGPGMVTTLTDAAWARVFADAGLPTEVEHDIDGFLRSHAAFVVPMMVSAQWTWRRPAPLAWAEARLLARAMREGLRLVESLGHRLEPRPVGWLARWPVSWLAALLWLAGRTRAVKDLGEFGPDEVRSLIDAMVAAAPARTPALRAIRP